jgi:hypothetical protein
LQVAEGSKAVILCDSLSTRSVPSGQPYGAISECPQVKEPVLQRQHGAIGNTRGNLDPLIPYIISPRMTRLLGNQPTLQWNKVPGAITYTVKIKGEGLNWSTETISTQIPYTGTSPLKPGTTYLLVVSTNNGKWSSDERMVGLGFSVLGDSDAVPIKASVQKLEQLGLNPSAQAFVQAQLFAEHGLIAEATQILENLVESGSQDSAVYRSLGTQYQRVGLNHLAEEYYIRALELSRKENDLEGEALVLNNLGLIYEAFGSKEEAVQKAKEAIEIYRRLGDAESIKQIEDRLANVK